MSVYERTVDPEEESIAFDQVEKHIYGSSRIGLHGEKIALLGTENDDYFMESMTHHIGDKSYELTNLPITIGMGNELLKKGVKHLV